MNDILEQELARLEKKGGLSECHKKEAAQRIRAKMLHAPHKRIQQAALNGGVKRYLEALHSLFDLEDENAQS